MAAKGWTVARALAGAVFGLVALAGLVALVYGNGYFVSEITHGGRNAGEPLAAALLGAGALAVGLLIAGPVAFRAPGVLFGLGILLLVLGFTAVMDGQAVRSFAAEMHRLGDRSDAADANAFASALTAAGAVAIVLGIAATVGFFVWYERRHARDPEEPPRGAVLLTEPPR